jgi:hypothetical protein
MNEDQREAVLTVARVKEWDRLDLHQLGLLVWAVFHYYVLRLRELQ